MCGVIEKWNKMCAKTHKTPPTKNETQFRVFVWIGEKGRFGMFRWFRMGKSILGRTTDSTVWNSGIPSRTLRQILWG